MPAESMRLIGQCFGTRLKHLDISKCDFTALDITKRFEGTTISTLLIQNSKSLDQNTCATIGEMWKGLVLADITGTPIDYAGVAMILIRCKMLTTFIYTSPKSTVDFASLQTNVLLNFMRPENQPGISNDAEALVTTYMAKCKQQGSFGKEEKRHCIHWSLKYNLFKPFEECLRVLNEKSPCKLMAINMKQLELSLSMFGNDIAQWKEVIELLTLLMNEPLFIGKVILKLDSVDLITTKSTYKALDQIVDILKDRIQMLIISKGKKTDAYVQDDFSRLINKCTGLTSCFLPVDDNEKEALQQRFPLIDVLVEAFSENNTENTESLGEIDFEPEEDNDYDALKALSTVELLKRLYSKDNPPTESLETDD